MAESKSKSAALLMAAVKEFDSFRATMSAQELSVLDRLAASKRAGEALAHLGVEPRIGGHIIGACIEAHEIARTFGSVISLERRLLGRDGKPGELDKLVGAVSDLTAFLEQLCQAPASRVAASINYSPEDVGAIKQGLYLLTDAIRTRKMVAEQTLLRLGSTRKIKGTAGETAAIGWIAEAVDRCCRRPHRNAAATLAEVVLRCEVTVDRIREAMRTRERPWHS